jgi:WD40 repeat protein
MQEPREVLRVLLTGAVLAAAGAPLTAGEAPADRHGDPLPEGALARLGTLRFRHELMIEALAFSPDGKTIAATGWGGGVRLWDAATGKELRKIPQPNHVRSVAFSPDGRTLAAAGTPIGLWDVATGKELRRLDGHEKSVSHVAFCPDGKTLVSVGDDQTIRWWDVDTGRELRRWAVDQLSYSVAFSPDGKTLAAAGLDQTLSLWDAASEVELLRFEGHEGDVWRVAFSPDGKRLASAGADATLRLWDPATGKELHVCAGHQRSALRVAFAPDGKVVASSDADGTIRFWDTATGKELRKIEKLKWWQQSLAFAPDGKTLASGGVRDSTVHLWDVATGTEVRPSGGHTGGVHSVAFTPDGKAVLSGSDDLTIRLWDRDAGEEVRRLEGLRLGPALLSPDGKVVAACGGKDLAVRLWDPATGKRLGEFGKANGWVQAGAFSPDGKHLALADRDGARLWGVATGKEVLRFVGPPEAKVNGLVFAPDGETLAGAFTAGENEPGEVWLWDAATGELRRRLHGHQGGVLGVAFAPDGKFLASGGNDGTVRLWDAAGGEERCRLTGHDGTVRAVAFAPDGRLLASAGGDRTVRLWEVAAGAEVKRFTGHQGEVAAVAFAPDGRALASGGGDCTVLVWDVTGRVRGGRLSELRLSGRELAARWGDLAAVDGPKGRQAVWDLAAAAEQAVPFLGERLRPVAPAAPDRVARLVADLDSDRFAARADAVRELERLAELAEPALRKALAGEPTAEVRRQGERLLLRLEGPVLSPERLRQLRALEVLERADTSEAGQVLEGLAKGAPEGWLTRQAKASLERLAGRGARTP